MNTSAVLPHMTWATKHPVGPPTGTGKRGPYGEVTHQKPGRSESDGESGKHSHSVHSHRRPHRVEDRKDRDRRDRRDRRGRRPSRHDVDDGWVDADDGYDAGGY